MQDVFPTPEGEAAWALFHRDVAVDGNMTSDRSCGGFALDEMKGDCKVCEGGCRVAWICLLRHGLSRGEYEACLSRLLPGGLSRPMPGGELLRRRLPPRLPHRPPGIVARSGVDGAPGGARDAARRGYRPSHGPTADLFGG